MNAMVIVVLVTWLVVLALLAPRFGVDSRDGLDRKCCR
jgi:hypothetical protein